MGIGGGHLEGLLLGVGKNVPSFRRNGEEAAGVIRADVPIADTDAAIVVEGPPNAFPVDGRVGPLFLRVVEGGDGVIDANTTDLRDRGLPATEG